MKRVRTRVHRRFPKPDQLRLARAAANRTGTKLLICFGGPSQPPTGSWASKGDGEHRAHATRARSPLFPRTQRNCYYGGLGQKRHGQAGPGSD